MGIGTQQIDPHSFHLHNKWQSMYDETVRDEKLMEINTFFAYLTCAVYLIFKPPGDLDGLAQHLMCVLPLGHYQDSR